MNFKNSPLEVFVNSGFIYWDRNSDSCIVACELAMSMLGAKLLESDLSRCLCIYLKDIVGRTT
jgi:hypothetical protein